jgi:uncharacterized protein YukE
MRKEEKYQELFNELQNRLKQLKKKLDQHRTDFIGNSNWSFVGDIQFVNEQLKNITEFLK